MTGLNSIPDWLGAAAAGAIIAALGYVIKQFLDWISAVKTRRDERRARLLDLYSLLSATRNCFLIQKTNINRLLEIIQKRSPQEIQAILGEEFQRRFDERQGAGQEPEFGDAPAKGVDLILSENYASLSPQERELHEVIRGQTVHAIKLINVKLSEWLTHDTYYKVQSGKNGLFNELAKQLNVLSVHLILWMAKYEIWIPDHPEHALVYLADEQQHGIGFPQGLDSTVAEILHIAPPAGSRSLET